MARRERDKYSHWENEKPVTDFYEALELLRNKQQGRYSDERYLIGGPTPEILVDWYREADSGGDRGGIDHYEIDNAVFEEIVRQGCVSPNVVKFYGGSRTEHHKLVLNKVGRDKFEHFLDLRQNEAKKLVIPGEHTKFSGVLNPRGYGREGYQGYGGELYFEFETPMNERLRVYPDSKRVVPKASA
ncbi:MAG: hypothetical protein AAB964_00030 [Patescibacteria group bacterium]